MNIKLREFIKKNLNLLIFLVPLCFYTIGFFIHNNYLSKFNVANYELIKGKYIFAGFVYTLILITVGFFYNVHISFSNPRDNFKKDNLFLWFFRFECILLIFYQIFPGKDELTLITTDLIIISYPNSEGVIPCKNDFLKIEASRIQVESNNPYFY